MGCHTLEIKQRLLQYNNSLRSVSLIALLIEVKVEVAVKVTAKVKRFSFALCFVTFAWPYQTVHPNLITLFTASWQLRGIYYTFLCP